MFSKEILLIILVLLVSFMVGTGRIDQGLLLPGKPGLVVSTQNSQAVSFTQARVIGVEALKLTTDSKDTPLQIIKVKILEGSEENKEVEITHVDAFSTNTDKKVKVGDTVVLTKTTSPEQSEYYISDQYRLPKVLILIGVFFAAVVLFARLKGLQSIVGMLFTILALAKFIVPNILIGHNPLVVTLMGSVVITVVTLFLAHGLKRSTLIAFISMVITFTFAVLFSLLAADFVSLSGTGSEASFYLQLGSKIDINLKGLLLSGMIIGALGVLDDITINQSVVLSEIAAKEKNPKFMSLVQSGFVVGQEHIASLVNTLVLAYAGAALPIFLIFSLQSAQPLWAILNSEFVTEEIVRTIVGSLSLVIAVPITTLIASYWYSRKYESKNH